MEKVEYYEISYNEFEDLIRKHYPHIKGYSFIADQECPNDTSHAFHNITAEQWDQYDEEQWEIDIVHDKNYSFAAEVFLKKLCRDKHIEPGNYLINVYW